jgi:adenylate cyclase
MRLDVLQKRNLSTAYRIVLAGIIISLVYPLFADGFTELIPYINSFFIGLIGGVFVSLCELEFFQGRMIFRSFLQRVALKTLVYFIAFVIVIPSVILFSESFYYGKGIKTYFYSEEFQNFIFKEDFGIILIYALAFICIVIFVREMSLKLGQGVLWNYLTGRYHKPRQEERVFMFIDLYNSTSLAEQMGGITFHAFINDFVKDLTDSILAFEGIIYRYVGDQIDITWRLEHGIKNAHCIRTFLATLNAIHRKREKYLKRYGVIPRFVSSLHCGQVVIGQLGDVKSQIVYLGDTIQELGQIEKEFKRVDMDLPILISERLLDKLQIPRLFESKKLGSFTSSAEEMGVFTIVEQKI